MKTARAIACLAISGFIVLTLSACAPKLKNTTWYYYTSSDSSGQLAHFTFSDDGKTIVDTSNGSMTYTFNAKTNTLTAGSNFGGQTLTYEKLDGQWVFKNQTKGINIISYSSEQAAKEAHDKDVAAAEAAQAAHEKAAKELEDKVGSLLEGKWAADSSSPYPQTASFNNGSLSFVAPESRDAKGVVNLNISSPYSLKNITGSNSNYSGTIVITNADPNFPDVTSMQFSLEQDGFTNNTLTLTLWNLMPLHKASK